MAQPFSRTPQIPIDSSSVSSPTTSYPLSDSHSSSNQTSICPFNIKEELYNNGSDSQETDTISNPLPKKRQKTVGQDSSRRFVSQQKWKFLDSQPWLAPRLSTKAQNASQALGKHKTEVAEAKQPLSLDIPSHTPDASENAVHAHLPYHSGPKPQQSISLLSKPAKRPKTRPQHSRSMAVPTLEQPSETSRNALASPPSRTHLTTSMGTSTMQQDQQASDHSNNESSHVSRVTPTSSERAAGAKARTPRSVNTLSLEKDADRIAALISEKKRENESSKFRERMLRRQLEHRDQRETGAELELNPGRHVGFPKSRSTTRDSSQCSEENAGNKPDSPLTHLNNPILQRTTGHGSVVLATSDDSNRATSGEDKRSEVQEKAPDPNPFGRKKSVPSSASFSRPQVQNEHEILFGKQPLSKPLARNDHFRVNETDEFNVAVPQSLRESGPFEAEDVDMASNLVTFTNKFIPPRSMQEMQVPRVDSPPRPRSQYFNRQSSTSLTAAHSQVLQHVNSTSSAKGQNLVSGPANTATSPVSLSSSQSPATLPAQRLAHIDVIAQSYQTQTHASSTAYSRPASAGRLTLHGVPASYPMSRPTWAFPQGATENIMANRITQSTPVPVATAWSVPSRPAQQQYSPPPILASNANVPNSVARPNTGSGAKPPSSKPRVNMFSNTKGTPFPMQEVIRQIEMT